MSTHVCSKEHLDLLESFQRDEVTASKLYYVLADKIKDEKNKDLINKINQLRKHKGY